MEVHAHTHTPRKKWTHYLFEFLMLFLAVFCGFLAENQREHMIEHGREKVYMTSLVEDLQKDTSWLIRALKFNDYLVKGGDTLRQTIYDVGIKDSAVKKLYVYSRQYLRPLSFEYTDRTSSQLKNSGAMRLIRNKKVADSIVNYWSNCQTTVFLQERYLFFLNKAGDFRNKILDSRYFFNGFRISFYYLVESDSILSQIFNHRTDIFNFSFMFYIMFALVFYKKAKCYSKKKHKELPEIMRPFFSWGMSVCMYFHK